MRDVTSLLLPLALLVATGWCQLVEDKSLHDACHRTGGQYTRRESPDATTGDVCEMPFYVWTKDQQEADELCELYAPWRLLKATSDGHTTTCRVEATLICKPGWKQMFGQCYAMPRKGTRMNLEEAQKTCKVADSRADIAYMQHRYIPGVWRRYFYGISQVWMRASETYEPLVKRIKNGSALALAFDGWHVDFTTMPMSLVRIDPAWRLEVLCQYTPSVTPAEIQYLARRYSEIYYPSVPLPNGALVRSASHYSRAGQNETWLPQCKKILKPFLYDDVDQMFPDEEVLEAIGELATKDSTFYRTDATLFVELDKMYVRQCLKTKSIHAVPVNTNQKANRMVVKFKPPQPRMPCDNMLSAAIVPRHDGAVLETMPDSQYAPVWCKLGARKEYKYTVPKDYVLFVRPHSGDRVAHKLVKESLSYMAAQEWCMRNGAVLSGADKKEELEKMDQMVRDADPDGAAKGEGRQVWVGARRRPECRDEVPFDFEPGRPCSRENVFRWDYGVAQLFSTDMWRDGPGRLNPDFASKAQECLTLAVGNLNWAIKGKIGLDDVRCDTKKWFFCQKKLEPQIVSTTF